MSLRNQTIGEFSLLKCLIIQTYFQILSIKQSKLHLKAVKLSRLRYEKNYIIYQQMTGNENVWEVFYYYLRITPSIVSHYD